MVKYIETFTEDPSLAPPQDELSDWKYKQENDMKRYETDHLWASQLVDAPSFASNDKGTKFNAVGRHTFEDVEKAGPLRVGAAWGVPGIFSAGNKDLVLGVDQDHSVHIGSYGSGRHATVRADGSLRVRGRGEFDSISFANGWQLKPKRHDLCFQNPHGVEFCISQRLPPRTRPWLIKPVDEQVNLVKK